MAIRFVTAKGSTFSEMHKNMTATPLFAIGDCVLVWVNEGDFWSALPTDVETEDRERKEYERLKAKFRADQ